MRIFISYAAEDRDIAEQIHFALTGAGYETFFDRANLPPAHEYHERIRAAVQQSDALVFLASPESTAPGSYALTELKYARAKWPHPKNHVIPVRVREVAWEAISNYLKAVTVLHPEGNTAAEVLLAVANLPPPAPSKNWLQNLATVSQLLRAVSLAIIASGLLIGLLWAYYWLTQRGELKIIGSPATMPTSGNTRTNLTGAEWDERYDQLFREKRTDEIELAKLGEETYQTGHYHWTVRVLTQARTVSSSGVWQSRYPFLAGAYLQVGDSENAQATLNEMFSEVDARYGYLTNEAPLGFLIANLGTVKDTLAPQDRPLFDQAIDRVIDTKTKRFGAEASALR